MPPQRRGLRGGISAAASSIADSADQLGAGYRQDRRAREAARRQFETERLTQAIDNVTKGLSEPEQEEATLKELGIKVPAGILGRAAPGVGTYFGDAADQSDKATSLSAMPTMAGVNAKLPKRHAAAQLFPPTNVPSQFSDPSMEMEQTTPEGQSFMQAHRAKRRSLITDVEPKYSEQEYDPASGAEIAKRERWDPDAQQHQSFGQQQRTATPSESGRNKGIASISEQQEGLKFGLPELLGTAFNRQAKTELPARVETAGAISTATNQAAADVLADPRNIKNAAAREAIMARARSRAELDGQISVLGMTTTQHAATLQYADDFDRQSAVFFIKQQGFRDIVNLAAAPPSAANDIALAIAYMKTNDPMSIVRETEQEQVRHALATLDTFKQKWAKIVTGEQLLEKVRLDLRDSGATLYRSASQEHQQRVSDFTHRASGMGLRPDLIIRQPAADMTGQAKPFDPNVVLNRP